MQFPDLTRPNTLRPWRMLLAGIACLLAVAGCAGGPPTAPRDADGKPDSALASAAQLAARGEHAAAAEAYLALAGSVPPTSPEQAEYRLLAARQQLAAGASKAAEATLVGTRIADGQPALRLRRDLLHAEIVRVLYGPGAALALLPASGADNLPPALLQELHDLRARLLLHSGDPLASARERLVLASLLHASAAVTINQRALLAALQTLGPALPDPAAVEPDLAGWIELTRLAAGAARNRRAFDEQLSAWWARHPDHPITTALIDELRDQLQSAAAPARIALLLPASGPFATAAGAIRDGFIAARLSAVDGTRTTLRFYDSESVPPGEIAQLYTAAVADGAQLVVGPLRKEAVAALAGAVPLTVPVLALNRLPPGTPAIAGLFQFALDPEHEAAQIAERAWLDGRRQMGILLPAGDFGRRAADAFQARFATLGGRIIDARSYAAEEHDFSDPITALLLLQQSQERNRRLRGVIGRSLEFEPRRRQDLDALFLVALPRQARQLRPQIDFHHAAELPLYASSHVYDPSSGAAQNHDLERLRFCDMPWTLLPPDPLLAGGLPSASGGLGRLFAFGVDAFGLLPYLANRERRPVLRLDGQTGLLSMAEDGYIARQLLCAQFVGGEPQPSGFTPSEFSPNEFTMRGATSDLGLRIASP